ncbi:unnamed protein product [Bursaphelenchus xylophilus]|uniref:(pine wood nematode) hypothetical protein n=1 Tax=Bursaphelenchus xylophilus TaxID=6326 RepID=A0A1I7SLS3_BURXY|nr:unnamed protein product [Bursaphelenchus xylophilus]CAG9129719.1 unnamed protein product [Bursaphelenchus xylophilus]
MGSLERFGVAGSSLKSEVDSMDGPERDAAEFMAELRDENPETYNMWLKIVSRDEFHEKFRRSFISALCKFCINRKQMELARYRRDFVACVLSYTKADIGVNLFCDKNGGGYLNNSLKSRRAYRKRLMESSWQQHTPNLLNEASFNTLLKSFQQSSTPSLELQKFQADISLLNQSNPSANQGQLENSLKEDKSSLFNNPDFLASINVFVRYRRLSPEWRDLEVKQTKFNLHAFSTAQTLLVVLVDKYQLNNHDDDFVLRIFDREFNEYIDIEEDLHQVKLINLGKYELIHRLKRDDDSSATISPQPCSTSQGNVASSSSRDTPSSTRSSTPPSSSLAPVLKEIPEEPKEVKTEIFPTPNLLNSPMNSMLQSFLKNIHENHTPQIELPKSAFIQNLFNLANQDQQLSSGSN